MPSERNWTFRKVGKSHARGASIAGPCLTRRKNTCHRGPPHSTHLRTLLSSLSWLADSSRETYNFWAITRGFHKGSKLGLIAYFERNIPYGREQTVKAQSKSKFLRKALLQTCDHGLQIGLDACLSLKCVDHECYLVPIAFPILCERHARSNRLETQKCSSKRNCKEQGGQCLPCDQ